MDLTLAFVAGSFVLVVVSLLRARRAEARAAAVRERALAEGLTEPPSLHPVIDPSKCAGCGTCVDACPESDVLGIVEGRVELVDPSHCIGHGACKPACPADAIELVFGTETRGVDIPELRPNFETNIPGIFIAGELGGMGLIRNAIAQGQQAIDSIAGLAGISHGERLDVLIVGAGPAGISASLAAMQRGLRYRTIEQESLGGTVAHYPRGKIVMTAPARLPLYGKMRMTETTKEKLLEFFESVQQKTGFEVSYQERLESIESLEGGFRVRTSKGSYESRAVLLAIGRRGSPRKLDVPGEELTKVVYRVTDPSQYAGQQVLVVGGGDSALEAAVSLSEVPETTVTLSYRSPAFNRAKEKNRQRVAEARDAGRLEVLMSSTVSRIEAERVVLEQEGESLIRPNSAVIICAGGELPTKLLTEAGIKVETKFGTA